MSRAVVAAYRFQGPPGIAASGVLHEAVSEILQFLGARGMQFDQSERRASTGCSSDAFQAG
jgi:hypothetical protein